MLSSRRYASIIPDATHRAMQPLAAIGNLQNLLAMPVLVHMSSKACLPFHSQTMGTPFCLLRNLDALPYLQHQCLTRSVLHKYMRVLNCLRALHAFRFRAFASYGHCSAKLNAAMDSPSASQFSTPSHQPLLNTPAKMVTRLEKPALCSNLIEKMLAF